MFGNILIVCVILYFCNYYFWLLSYLFICLILFFWVLMMFCVSFFIFGFFLYLSLVFVIVIVFLWCVIIFFVKVLLGLGLLMVVIILLCMFFMLVIYFCDDVDECIFDIFMFECLVEMVGRDNINIIKKVFLIFIK